MRYGLRSVGGAIGCGILGCGIGAVAAERDYPFRPVAFTDVRVTDAFWTPRLETNRLVTSWYDINKCEETGRVDNFAKAGGLLDGEFRGIPFDDSDVYKVLEGVAYILAQHPDPKLEGYLDTAINRIISAQERDGYLYTARRLLPPEKLPKMAGPTRWSNLGSSHELYNVGHLYEAAVAHFQATGKRTLLDVATRNADLLLSVFGPGRLQEPPGHQEIEIGLTKLYRATGNRDYLELAKFFLDIRGRESTHRLRGPGQQDHEPVTKQSEAVGHAVRAAYMYAGMADVAALTGEALYVDAIGRIWENVVGRKLYLTGGIGARHQGEAFGDDYELPNASAYNETCAAIANALWNHRMFLLHGEAKYIDVLERIVYNGFLSGISLMGDRFFYPNPLESDGRRKFNHGASERSPWFGCACCPPNVLRFLGSLGGMVYAARGDSVYVNLFVGGEADIDVAGRKVSLTQETRYPWAGVTRLAIGPEAAGEFAVHVRVPGWAVAKPVPGDLYRYADGEGEGPEFRVNGEGVRPAMEKGYAVFRRAWKAGDAIEMALPMPVRRVLAHEAVKEDAGRVAVERGPVVYCAEGADNRGSVLDLVLPDGAALVAEERRDLLGGLTVIRGKGARVRRDDGGEPVEEAAEITLIPYYAWCHRGANPMAVWLARTAAVAKAPPKATIAGESVATASHCHGSDATDALHDGIEPTGSGDHGVPRFTWWDHRGTKEWVQYEFAKPARVSSVAVYWFDDTGRGQCRVPATWRLLERKGDAWAPVYGAGVFGVAKDSWNTVRFPAIETAALRIEVQLREKYSGGILEWRVE